jgi:hypothetical protein
MHLLTEQMCIIRWQKQIGEIRLYPLLVELAYSRCTCVKRECIGLDKCN